MSLKPWREIAIPHKVVREGQFQQSEFAADLSMVHAGTASAEYLNPTLFFQRTFITEGMGLLLQSVVKRLAGQGGDPVIQLQTAFGGGKTHTMLAVYHLARGNTPAHDLPGVSDIMDKAGVVGLQPARIAVLDGIKLSPSQSQKHGSVEANTMWGELAWQLGGDAGYGMVQEADQAGTSPGKDVLAALLTQNAPCVVLMDELVAYLRQFEPGKSYKAGTFDSNLSFIQALTEAVKAVPNAIVLASLPDSHNAGGEQGQKALRELESYFGRLQAIWKPVATEEAFEIVRRRLFETINDQLAAEEVCRAFQAVYEQNRNDFPQETQTAAYHRLMMSAYPIHPEVFARLYEDWSSLENFQRTRGVLKLMAKVIHSLWMADNHDLMVMPGSLPLDSVDVSNELISYLSQGWNPVFSKDIDGKTAESTLLDANRPMFGKVQAARRSARTIMLGSAPTSSNKLAQGLELNHVLLGVVQPEQSLGVYKDALRALQDKLSYLSVASNRFWFDTRPNLRREMEDRKRRFDDRDHIRPEIQTRIQRAFASGMFTVHPFNDSKDVMDDWALKLVVLPPEVAHSRTGASAALERAADILKSRGDTPRQRQNRLLFLAPDYDNVSRLREMVRTWMAWRSIVNDIKTLNLDQHQATQAQDSLANTEKALKQTLRECFKWLLAPHQEERQGRLQTEISWEVFPLNAGAANLTQEVERVLTENELVITRWAPVHLQRLLDKWYWKDDRKEVSTKLFWEDTSKYLYLPRLQSEEALMTAMALGAESTDFFAYAQAIRPGSEKYAGFVFGKRTVTFISDESVLISHHAAVEYQALLLAISRAKDEAVEKENEGDNLTDGEDSPQLTDEEKKQLEENETAGLTSEKNVKNHFYGGIELDAKNALPQFINVFNEVIALLNEKGRTIQISIDIRADAADGFDDGTQRAIRENCNVLKFNSAEFD